MLSWLINLKFRGGSKLAPKPTPFQLTVVDSANCVVPVDSQNCVVPVVSQNSLTVIASQNSLAPVSSKNSIVLL